jgi:hypothetical protein
MHATRKSARAHSIATMGFVPIPVVISEGRMCSACPLARRAGSHFSLIRLNTFLGYKGCAENISPEIGSYVSARGSSRGPIP